MFIEKTCKMCSGSGQLHTTTALIVTCYDCKGTGIVVEEFECGDMRYDKFMEHLGNLLYWYSIEGYISDEAGELIYDDIYKMVEDKGIVSIEDYYKIKGIIKNEQE